MEANNTHISLKTAKLLKDCGVESEYLFILFDNNLAQLFNNKYENGDWIQNDSIPAYTWQEILWEYPVLFFGEKKWKATYPAGGYCDEAGYPADILNLLQQKKYDQADKYFRDNCILIK